MSIVTIITIALLVEAIWETLKLVWQEGKLNLNTIGALIVGIGVSILAKIDIFAMQEISLSIPLVGWILTGILMSRGANFIHDLFNKLGDKKEV